jgi:hypothetical protein
MWTGRLRYIIAPFTHKLTGGSTRSVRVPARAAELQFILLLMWNSDPTQYPSILPFVPEVLPISRPAGVTVNLKSLCSRFVDPVRSLDTTMLNCGLKLLTATLFYSSALAKPFSSSVDRTTTAEPRGLSGTLTSKLGPVVNLG